MLDILVIENLAQLKCISDPFRIKLLELLAIEAKTGQQLADELEIPRAKIHYHLAELEKQGIIELVKTEQKHSIIQKFYAPVAKQIVPNLDLLKYAEIEKKKDNISFKLQMNEADLPEFKKEFKKYIKKASSKNGDSNYQITIIPDQN